MLVKFYTEKNQSGRLYHKKILNTSFLRGVFVKLSHSRVETFVNCPRKFKFRYINKINAPKNLEPNCALTIGTFLHIAIEKDIKTAIKYYYDQFPIITNKHIEEVMKIEYWIPKILEMIPRFGVHEIRIENNDFVGCIDFLAPVKKVDNIEYFDMYDWKYSNGIERYKKSGQLHEYKYFFEKINPNKKIRDMYFLFVPKTQIRMKKKNKKNKRDETVQAFRKRMKMDMEAKSLELVKIKYDPKKVIEFLANGLEASNCRSFQRKESGLCKFCEYKNMCKSK